MLIVVSAGVIACQSPEPPPPEYPKIELREAETGPPEQPEPEMASAPADAGVAPGDAGTTAP